MVALGGGELIRGSVAWRSLGSNDRIPMVVRVERIGVAIPTPLRFRRCAEMTAISADRAMAMPPTVSAARRSHPLVALDVTTASLPHAKQIRA